MKLSLASAEVVTAGLNSQLRNIPHEIFKKLFPFFRLITPVNTGIFTLHMRCQMTVALAMECMSDFDAFGCLFWRVVFWSPFLLC